MSVLSHGVVFVVVRRYSWDKDDYICAYTDHAEAEKHRDVLNGEPYDPDGVLDHQVWTIPFRNTAP